MTKEEYAKVGGKKLGEQLEQQLKAQGRKPYVIPVGGSDAIGTFGYLAATQEILDQAGKEAFTDIINVSPFLNATLLTLRCKLTVFVQKDSTSLTSQT